MTLKCHAAGVEEKHTLAKCPEGQTVAPGPSTFAGVGFNLKDVIHVHL